MLLLFVGSGILLAPPAWRWGGRVVTHMQSHWRWRAWCREPSRIPQTGQPSYWLTIPDCDIDALVLMGNNRANLGRSICSEAFYRENGTPLQVFSGHRDTHFRRLQRVAPGSELTLRHADGSSVRYRIVDIETVAQERLVDCLAANTQPGWIAIFTCFPFRYIGPAPERYIVWAAPISVNALHSNAFCLQR